MPPSQRLNAFNMHIIAMLTWNSVALKCLICFFVANITTVRNKRENITGFKGYQQTLYRGIFENYHVYENWDG